MEELRRYLAGEAKDGLISWATQIEAAARFRVSLARVEETALDLAILPARYQRNRQAISVGQQLKLFRGRVAVVGCGGLGGYVIEELSRLGVGTIIAIDPDFFEEHNLNRQLLSSPARLGQAKVEAAAARIAEINPAVTLVPVQAAYGTENAVELFQDVDVVVDALDSVPTRLALADSCDGLGLPLVHGAIGGWFGQVTTQFPGDRTIRLLYDRWVEGKGLEQQMGNPSFTPAVIAGIQTAEVCKLLMGTGDTLRNRQLCINLLTMEFEEVELSSPDCAIGQ
ncbi:HesA/MoeB/ThiF family protein [Geobacter sp.]|uniref:HesA/MoeB/ThiF family protein n=1 Tax=Geobacter sp. TaxID=46610 RepID=UPI0027B96E56|nr:HesA/MoeB/ThiF family protein [Geobacter sp.]